MRTVMTLSILSWIALLPAPGALAAQDPGSTVRVNGETVAQFQRVDSTGVYLDTGFIPFDQLEYLEIRTGFKRNTAEGVLLGALTGLAVPVLGSRGCRGDLGCEVGSGLIALITVPGGALVGGIVGYSMKTPIFEPLGFPLILGNGIGVGFRLRF